jgi:hypothetical protein
MKFCTVDEPLPKPPVAMQHPLGGSVIANVLCVK